MVVMILFVEIPFHTRCVDHVLSFSVNLASKEAHNMLSQAKAAASVSLRFVGRVALSLAMPNNTAWTDS